MLYIQALELVSKEVAINLLEHLSMLYIQAFRAGSQRSGNQLVGAPHYVIYSGFSGGLQKKWQSTWWSTSVCYIFRL